MVTGISIQTDLPNIEKLHVTGGMGGTNLIDTVLVIDRNELTENQKTKYDEAVSVVTPNYFNTITNTTEILTINRVTSTTLNEGNETIDFEELDADDQLKLLGFIDLLNELKS